MYAHSRDHIERAFVLDATQSLSDNTQRLVQARMRRILTDSERTTLKQALEEGLSVLQAGGGLARVTMRVTRGYTQRLARDWRRGATGDPEAAPGGGAGAGRQFSTATPGVGGASVANAWARTRRLHASSLV